jgi:hypothetical protein
MSGKIWKFRQDGRMHYAIIEDADMAAGKHKAPIAFISFVEREHRDLIAAAPEMLEALQSCVDIESETRLLQARYGIEIPQSLQDAFSMMNSAIAKAEGRAQK